MSGLDPVYLLTGSDRPKIERALQRLRDRLGRAATEALSADQATGADVVAACNARGLFSDEARLVVVERVEAWKKGDADVVATYLADPAPETVLALVAGPGMKKDSALVKAARRAGTVLDYTISKRDLPRWVAEQFALLGARADHDACAALVHLVGEDPISLTTEIDKLATWAAGEPIGEEEVEILVGASAETPTFQLTEAMALRDTARALSVGEAIFDREPRPRRDTAPRLAAALGTHVQRLQQARRLAEDGVQPRAAAGTLRVHPFFAQKLFEQAERFSDDELSAATVRLARLDHALKGGSRLAPDLELQLALVDLCRGAGQSA